LQKFSEKNTVGDNDSGAISVAPFDNKIFKCKFVYKYLFLIPVMFREGMMWVMSYYKALCHPERSEGSQKGATETITTFRADSSLRSE
ncbi:MAG: hypothetical protein IJB03_02630, partial [Alistipes sp.]|nr:hypothetical protein [Alistipes sp.]